MKYQKKTMPQDAVKVSSTPKFDETTVPAAILHRHMAPAGKMGRLVVDQGKLQLVWEDTGEMLDADPGHPVIIEPERYHHVHLTGPAVFHVEFYRRPKVSGPADASAPRPGKQYL